ncbi:hypothetical protein ACFL21_02655 [Patescibacteria group bacterium]
MRNCNNGDRSPKKRRPVQPLGQGSVVVDFSRTDQNGQPIEHIGIVNAPGDGRVAIDINQLNFDEPEEATQLQRPSVQRYRTQLRMQAIGAAISNEDQTELEEAGTALREQLSVLDKDISDDDLRTDLDLIQDGRDNHPEYASTVALSVDRSFMDDPEKVAAAKREFQQSQEPVQTPDRSEKPLPVDAEENIQPKSEAKKERQLLTHNQMKAVELWDYAKKAPKRPTALQMQAVKRQKQRKPQVKNPTWKNLFTTSWWKKLILGR